MWPLLLILFDTAEAHSVEFGATALSARAENPDEVWAAAEGWGLVHSGDGGASWGWLCEESIGTGTIYDVLAWDEGEALVGTQAGVSRVGADCTGTTLTGLPSGFVLRLARWGSRAAAAFVGNGEGGVYTCDTDACTATTLEGAGFYPKSFAVDGETLWATLVHTDTLAAELYRTTDGINWTLAHSWADGDSDPRVLWASGETVYVWLRPRSDSGEPSFLRSTDGGATFTTTFATGYYTDPAPGFVVHDSGKTVLLGSWFGARTWRSDDAGQSFSEVSTDLPAVRCGLDLGDHALVCNDHLADRVDISITTDLRTFSPIACLEEVAPADCATATCEPYVDAWVTAGAYGGGGCHPEAEDSGGDSGTEPGCGCGGSSEAGASSVLVALAVQARRRRKITWRR